MLWATLMLQGASAADNEIYAAPHLDVHQSASAFGAAAGGQVGYRRHFGDYTVGGSAFLGGFQWLGGTVELEAGRHFRGRDRVYRPWVGLEVVGWVNAYAIESAEHPTPWRGPAMSARLAARPLVFTSKRGTVVSVLEMSYGQGFEAMGQSLVVSVSPIVVGTRW